jgi:hypothetical protein
MSRYTNVNVNISEGQTDKIKRALEAGVDGVSIKLSHDDLSGEHVLALTQAQCNKMAKAYQNGKGVTIKMSKTQLAHNAKVEGGFIGAILPFLATAGKFLLSKVLPSLATGAMAGIGSTAASKIVDKISGSGVLYVNKGGIAGKIKAVGDGLYLSPWPKGSSMGEGLYLKNGKGMFMKPGSGSGLILGPNSPFQNIPLLGWLL